MLPARHRLTRSADFRAATRGRRAGSSLIVVHAVPRRDRQDLPPRVGLVVSKAVGCAVVRNRVKRRLRHCVAHELSLLPQGVDIVIRANPAAAQATSQQLSAEYVRLLRRAVETGSRRQAPPQVQV